MHAARLTGRMPGTSTARDSYQHALPERSHPRHCLPTIFERLNHREPNNVKNGTSTARGSFPHAQPL